MTTITPEQRLAIEQAGDRPVPLTDPATNETFVLLRSDVFDRVKALLDESEAVAQERAWLDRAKKTRLDWVRENPTDDPAGRDLLGRSPDGDPPIPSSSFRAKH